MDVVNLVQQDINSAEYLYLRNAKLVEWYNKNEKPIYALVIYAWDRVYYGTPPWQDRKQEYELGTTFSDVVRNIMNFFFKAGLPYVIQNGPTNENGYCYAIFKHLDAEGITRNLNPQDLWDPSSALEKKVKGLLKSFCNYAINEALKKRLKDNWNNEQFRKENRETVELFNTRKRQFNYL